MAKEKSKAKAEEKKPGLVDRLLHGDHGHATESEEAEVSEPEVSESKESEKENSPKGDAGDLSKHPKFAKVKKGN